MLMGTPFKWLVLAAIFGLIWAIVLWPMLFGKPSSGNIRKVSNVLPETYTQSRLL